MLNKDHVEGPLINVFKLIAKSKVGNHHEADDIFKKSNWLFAGYNPWAYRGPSGIIFLLKLKHKNQQKNTRKQIIKNICRNFIVTKK